MEGTRSKTRSSMWWECLWIIFSKLDARSLASCCCVSKSWLQVATHDDLWSSLCSSLWPSLLLTDSGRNAVSMSGGFHSFYSARQMAALHHLTSINGRRRSKPPRLLRLRELLFLLDVHYNETPVCSLVRAGEALRPMFPPTDDVDQGSFRFVVDVSRDSSCCSGSWRKWQMKEFTISWAVMVKGSSKVFQILHTGRSSGQLVGNTCNYSQRLPSHSCCCCCCLTDNNHVAEVDLYFSESGEPYPSPPVMSQGSDRGGGDENMLFFLRELRCSLLNTDCWRYFTLAQALQYLQHALLHEHSNPADFSTKLYE